MQQSRCTKLTPVRATVDVEHPPQRQSTICELTFPTTILAVKLNRRRLVVVLEERIYVYDISNMKLLHEIETSPNPQGEPRGVNAEVKAR